MALTVLYFAAARERAGLAEERLAGLAAPATVRALLAELSARHPSLVPLLPHLRVAVNQTFAGLDEPVPEGAEVALIPPVAGGAGLFRVVDRPPTLDEVVGAVRDAARGGLVTFTGVVRGESRGRQVLRLTYEAYTAMAERVLAEVGSETERRWPGARLAIVHRVGVLEPGDVAVVIAAAAPHRSEAFEACRFAIEQLKQQAPIWKRETYQDGEEWVGLGP
ncbi:MAG TPA: molybdenum cofactor biosynthesis protein MoaE [Myxococcaceae bacterium]|nr:molybdenum cofactor biosynthesis protein MoaE [Myxococcaceae bacterium]